jgi:hypothetical protein
MLAAGLGALGIAGLIVFSASGIKSRFGHDVRALQTASRVNHYCLDVFPGKEDFNYCKGTSDEPPEVIFLGDSRTQAVFEAMAALSHERYPMLLLARGGCPPMLNVRSQQAPRHGAPSCDATWHKFVNAVHYLRPGLVVIVGGGSELVPADGAAADEIGFEAGLGELISALQAVADVIYLRETPGFDSGPDCFLRPVKVPWGTCAPVVSRAVVEDRMASYNHAVDEVAARFPGLIVVDSVQALCTSKYCTQKARTGELLYRDPLHLTFAGAQRLGKSSGLSSMIDKEVHEESRN